MSGHARNHIWISIALTLGACAGDTSDLTDEERKEMEDEEQGSSETAAKADAPTPADVPGEPKLLADTSPPESINVSAESTAGGHVVAASDSDGSSCSGSSCSIPYEGDFTFTAQPDFLYRFVGWQGDNPDVGSWQCEGDDPVETGTTVTGEQRCKAIFESVFTFPPTPAPVQPGDGVHAFNANVTATAGGTATVTTPYGKGTGECNGTSCFTNGGESVTMQASAGFLNRFVGWQPVNSDPSICHGDDATIAFTMPKADVTCQAVFESIFTIPASPPPNP